MKTIGILCHGQVGDCMVITSVFRYRKELWGDCKIIWWIAEENKDLLKYQDVEVRIFPRGFGYPQMVIEENKKLEGTDKPIWEDWLPLVDANNHLNLELKNNYPSLTELDYGYFPAPHQVSVIKRHGWEYSEVSKKVFGVPDHYEWHPSLLFSNEERNNAGIFINNLPPGKKIFWETFAGSGQSRANKEMIQRSMDICREQWPGCIFIFASHKFLREEEEWPLWLIEQLDVYLARKFTARQCALIANLSDLMISVSSGITVASSAWDIRQPPTIQFCGSTVCGTKYISHCDFKLVTADDKPFEYAKAEYYAKLTELLKTYK